MSKPGSTDIHQVIANLGNLMRLQVRTSPVNGGELSAQ